jgi:hypothetical protein
MLDGSVRGTYSYIDANDVVQRVDYISDALGFRVAATNLPQSKAPVEGPDAPVSPAHVQPVIVPAQVEKVVSGFVVPASYGVVTPAEEKAIAAAVPVATPVQPTPYVVPAPYYGPITPYAAPQVAPYASQYAHVEHVPSPITASQYHAQTEFGEYNYGYNNQNSAKSELKTFDPRIGEVTRGSYSYVDANNVVQRVDYIADDLYGFRVAATNLPVAPAPIAVPAPVAAPAPAAAPEVDSSVVIEE